VDGENAVAASHDAHIRLKHLRDGERLVRTPTQFRFRRAGRARELVLTTLRGGGTSTVEIESHVEAPCRWIGGLSRPFSVGELRRRFPRLHADTMREILGCLVDAEALQFVPNGV
jgi:hypothetical protein